MRTLFKKAIPFIVSLLVHYFFIADWLGHAPSPFPKGEAITVSIEPIVVKNQRRFKDSSADVANKKEEKTEKTKNRDDTKKPVFGTEEGRDVSAKERYLLELRKWILDQVELPSAARMLGQSGMVKVQVTIKGDGSFMGVKLSEASAYIRLNQAALDLIRNLGKFKPLPEGHPTLSVEIPIEYHLE
jgi:TonB family protein